MRAAELVLDGPEVAAAETRRAPADVRLRALFEAHFDFVWRSLRRLGLDDAAADDAAQRVWIVAAQKLERIGVGDERSFLFGVVLRVASEARRAQERRRDVQDEASLLAAEAPGADPGELLDARRARALLDRALAALPLELGAVLVLHELEELSSPEIARVLGIPLGTVASRLRRARERFDVIAAELVARAVADASSDEAGRAGR